VDIQKKWRPIQTAQRFSMAHPKSLQPTLAVTLWPVPKCRPINLQGRQIFADLLIQPK
jgi:hypothetical protein